MEFWGVEVKPGQSLKVQPETHKLIHLSQISLGEVKDGEGPENVLVRLKIGDKDFVIANLAAGKRSQLCLDLVLEKKFELSHGWKDGSVYFLGYTADDLSDLDISSDFEEDVPVAAPKNDAENDDTDSSSDDLDDSDDDEDDDESSEDKQELPQVQAPSKTIVVSSSESEDEEESSEEEDEAPEAPKKRAKVA